VAPAAIDEIDVYEWAVLAVTTTNRQIIIVSTEGDVALSWGQTTIASAQVCLFKGWIKMIVSTIRMHQERMAMRQASNAQRSFNLKAVCRPKDHVYAGISCCSSSFKTNLADVVNLADPEVASVPPCAVFRYWDVGIYPLDVKYYQRSLLDADR